MTAGRRPAAAGRAPRAGSRPGAAARAGARPAPAPGTRAGGTGEVAGAGSGGPVKVGRTRRTTRLAILGLIALALVVAIAPTLRVYLNQRAQISALQSKQADQRREVAGLQAQAQRWNDPAYIEAQARARLQFVKPGQRSYVVSDPKPVTAAAPVSGVVAGATDSAGRSWMDGLWQSIQKAGASPGSTGK